MAKLVKLCFIRRSFFEILVIQCRLKREKELDWIIDML